MLLRQAKFTLTTKDVAAVLLPYHRAQFLCKKTFLGLVAIWLVGTLVAIAVLVGIQGSNSLMNWDQTIIEGAFIYLLIVLLLIPLEIWFLIPHRVNSLIAKEKQLGLEQTIIWDEYSLSIRSSYLKGTYPLRLIFDWHEYPCYFALYLDKKHFKILPKAALSAAQIDDFRAILTRAIIYPE